MKIHGDVQKKYAMDKTVLYDFFIAWCIVSMIIYDKHLDYHSNWFICSDLYWRRRIRWYIYVYIYIYVCVYVYVYVYAYAYAYVYVYTLLVT